MPEQQEPPVPPPPGVEVINLADSDDEGQLELDIDNMTYEELQVRFPGNGKKPASKVAISRLRRFCHMGVCLMCEKNSKMAAPMATRLQVFGLYLACMCSTKSALIDGKKDSLGMAINVQSATREVNVLVCMHLNAMIV